MRLRSVPYKYVVAAVFVVAVFMDLLDMTIVNVALPTLGKQFHAANNTLVWVVTGYLLSLAIWIPASGWIGDRVGTKKTFLFALAIFTLSSALCGLAWNMSALIGFRILQGVGGGMLTPVGSAMLFRAFPPNERARASSILAVPAAIGPALGPVLGGLLVDKADWRWVFYVNVPIGALGFVFALLFLREHREPATGRFDPWGFVFSGCGLALALYALSRAPDDGWTSFNVAGSGILGLVIFAALIITELRATAPMLNLRLFANRLFRGANIVMLLFFGGYAGLLFVLPLFLQQLRGLSALESGLTTFPQAAGVIVGVPLAGRLYHRVGPRRFVMVAFAGTAGAAGLLLLIDLQTALPWVAAILFGYGLAAAFSIIAIQTATFATIAPAEMGQASSLFSTVRQVGSSLGVAALATVLVTRGNAHVAAAVKAAAPAAQFAARRHGLLLGFHDAYAAAALIALVGVAAALLIQDADAAATMQPASERPEAELPELVAGHAA
ncbi:MAG TPA: DHA2 family efflux MFS transporter permease subunit [Dehalococcoidia bacterium]|nr:DHA2 family efflux MFS transporter permease subunit [Dehalococcoidia bacterium]